MFAGQYKWVKSCLAGMLLLTAYLTTLVLPLTAGVLPQVDDNNAPAFGANTYTFELAKDTPGNSTAVSVGFAPAADLDVTDILTYSLEPLVYMLGNDLDALYTLNTDTGVASKVITTTTEFGVGENLPTGLVWHKNKLYMVGQATDALYTVDPGTGAATRVGIHHRFGIREDEPWGLASDGITLHMVGSALNDDDYEETPGIAALYTLNIDTGEATRVGTQNGFGVSENSPAGLSWHNGTLYMLGDDTDALYTVNTATGTATKVGSAAAFGVAESTPGGLASSGGKLYMTGRTTYALYTLNTNRGVATRVGSDTAFGAGEYSPTGMATPYHPSDAINPDFAIDNTGAITYKGTGEHTGYRNFLAVVSDGKDKDTAIVQVTVSNNEPAFSADSYNLELPKDTSGSPTALEVGSILATDADTGDTVSYSLTPLVYMVGQTNKALYTLDIQTGVATQVDSTTVNFGSVAEEKPTGLAWLDGKLYITGQTNDALYTVDIVTGLATKVGTSTKFGIKEDQPWGLASSTKGGVSTLHMVGSASDGGGETNNAALYTLNASTGAATRVGEAYNFGPGGDYSPTGLSWHKDTLYMLGQQYRSLYGLRTSDGTAEFNQGAYEFHVAEILPTGLASVGNKLYMTGQTNKVLYQVDIASSLAVRVGNAEQFGVGENLPTGIAAGYDPSNFVVSNTGAITYNGAAQSEGGTLFFLATATDGEHQDTAVVKVTVTTPDTASLSPAPSTFTIGDSATEFTLTTNVSDGIKVKVTQGTGAMAMSATSGTPECTETLDIEEDVGNGGKVKMIGCSEGTATVKLLKGTTELASYAVTISPADTAGLSPEPSNFTVGAAATAFTVNTNVVLGVKVKITQGTGTMAMSDANGTPSCESPLDIEEDVTNGGKVKIVGCTVGDATVKLLNGATELASYAVMISAADTASLSPMPSTFTIGDAATEFTLTTNVATGVKVKITQGTGSVAISAANNTPSCSGTLDVEENLNDGGEVKIIGCSQGNATVKLLNGATELASYAVMISAADTASLSPMPSTFTIGDAATEFTLTTNVTAGVKVKITQGTGTLSLAASGGTPLCGGFPDTEEVVSNSGEVSIIGCFQGTATVKLLNGATELASYAVTISPADTASLSPEPSNFMIGSFATEFTLTTNVGAGIKVQITQGTGTVTMSDANGTPSCVNPLDIEEDLIDGGKVKIVGCTVGDATVKLLNGATELANYTVTISPADAASLSPEPVTFILGDVATAFTVNTNVVLGVKVKITQGTGTMAMSDANGTPSCESPLDIEEDVTNGGKVKIVGCTVGDATVQLLKGAAELASYAVTISPADMSRLSPEPSNLTVGAAATAFTLTTNVAAGVKVKITQGTGTMAMSDANGTPSCESPLDIEEDVTNGGKVKIIGCSQGTAIVQLLKDNTELANYAVTISSADTAGLSPMPSAFTIGDTATEFTLTTSVATGVKVKILQGTGTLSLAAANGTPLCTGSLDIEEDVTNSGKVKMIGCTEGTATVKLLNGATELASYSVTISPADMARLSPEPSNFTVEAAATEFTLTTNVSDGINVQVTQGTGTVAMSGASGTPVCDGNLNIEEDVTNGGKVKIIGCTAGDATVKLLNGATELASYAVTISPADTASLSPEPSNFTVGAAATAFTLTTSVATGVKVKILQGTGTMAMSTASGTPLCSGILDLEEVVGNGGKVKIIGCTTGDATVKLLNGATALAIYTVTISLPDTARLSPEPSTFTVGNSATEFTLTTNVSAGIKVQVTQGTGTMAMSTASGTPLCSGILDLEEVVGNDGEVKIIGCSRGVATVKLLKGAMELASYAVTISPADTASLSPAPSTFTVGAAATEFTLTTNVMAGVKVKITQGTGTLSLAAAGGTPLCGGIPDTEEVVTNGGDVSMFGCLQGSATIQLLKGTTELASYPITISPGDTASLSPAPSTFTVGAAATEFTLTTNVTAGVKVKITQGTGTLSLAAAGGTPLCGGFPDTDEVVSNGGDVSIIGCFQGSATVSLLKDSTLLASYSVTISLPNTANLSPEPSTFMIGSFATEFTLTTNVGAGIKVQITQGTGTVTMSDANGTPSCVNPLDIEEDLIDGGKVKILGCTVGAARVKLLNGATELASYTLTISLPDTASLSPEPSTFMIGSFATEFTLTTNVGAGIKVQITQGTGTVTMSAASGTPVCASSLDIEENVTNGVKVKMVGCTAGAATVKLLKGATELAIYTVTISPADTASLSPVPSTFTVGAVATQFTLTTNVATGVKVKIIQGTGTVTMSDASDTPSCDGSLDLEKDGTNGDKVKIIGCTVGDATVKLLKGTTELASYTATISPADTASLSPEPSAFTVGAAATAFTLTTNVTAGVKVKITQGTGTLSLAAAGGIPLCGGFPDTEEVVNNGGDVSIIGCAEGSATVSLLKDAAELASYPVTISPPDSSSLSPEPLAFTLGTDATEFTLTTNVAAGVKVKIIQGTGSVDLSEANSTPMCGATLDVEEDLSNGDKIKMVGCSEGSATIKLLNGTTELASYAVTILLADTASLSPEPSAFTVDRPATEFTLTTNVVTGAKVEITQGTGTVAMSAANGTPSCIGPLDIEEDLVNGGKVKMVGCTKGSATIKLLRDATELASYPVTITPSSDTASLSPEPSEFTTDSPAMEFTLTTNVVTGVKVEITQGTGTLSLAAAGSTPLCIGFLDVEEDLVNGDKVKVIGCTEGSATIKLLKDATELASYAVTILLADTASLSPEPSAFTVGTEATEFTLTTNVVTGVKVQITLGTGSVAMSSADGTPSCIGPLDIEEDLVNGGKVKIVGCTEGSATVKLLKDNFELASYPVTITPSSDTASLSPEPSEFTTDSPAMEFTLTTNVVTGVKVEITQGIGTLSLAAAGSIPLCIGFLDVEEDLVNGGKVKVIGCTEGSATIKLLKDATELASYPVTIFPLEAARLSPIPATFTVGADATEFTLTTIESAGLKVKVTQGTGSVALSDATDTPSCTGILDVEEDVLNGGKVKMVGCSDGSATVKLLNGITVVASYIVTVSTPITASLPIPVRHSMPIGDIGSFALTTSADSVWVGVNYNDDNHLGMGGDCPADIGGRVDNDGAVFGNGDTVSIKACSVGIGEVRIYEETTELATYTVAVTSSGLTSLSMPARHSMPMGAVESFNLITNSDYVWVGVNYDGNNHLGVGGDCPADNGGRETNDGAVYSNGDAVSIRACSVGTGEVRMYQGTAHLASYPVTVSSSGTASLSPEPSVHRVGDSATEFSLTTNIATGVKVKVTQGTGTLALSAPTGTPSCSGTLDVEEDINNGGKIKIVGCTQGSATVKLLKDTFELASYTVTVPESAGLLPTPGPLNVGESITLRVATSIADSPGVWVGVNYPYDTGSLAIDGGLQGSDCDSTGANNGIVRTGGQSVTIRGCSAGASTIRIYKYQQVLASYSISVAEEGSAPVPMNMAHLSPESLKVGQFHIFTLETGIADPQGLWVGVNYGGTGNLVIDGSCMGSDNNGDYFSNGDTVVIIACRAGTGDIRISHGETVVANYTIKITGAS